MLKDPNESSTLKKEKGIPCSIQSLLRPCICTFFLYLTFFNPIFPVKIRALVAFRRVLHFLLNSAKKKELGVCIEEDVGVFAQFSESE